MRFLTACLCFASLALVSTSSAQQRELRQNVPPGTEVRFSERMTFDVDMTMNMNGQQQNMQQKIDGQMSGTMKVLESQNGKPTKAQLTFAQDSGIQTTTMGQQQPQPFPLAGRTVTVTRDAGGQITVEPPAQLDQATLEQLGNMLDVNDDILPGRAVAVGDTWQPPADAAQGFIPGMTPQAQLRLTGFSQQNGREVAQLQMEMRGQGDMQGVNSQFQASGPIVIDVETGIALSSSLTGTLTMKGQQQQAGMVANVDGTGRLQSNNTGTILVVGQGGGGNVMPEPAVMDENQPPLGGNNPVAGELVGKYADGTLTVEILPDNAVMIQMGGQTYPGRLSSTDPANLAGTFNASGQDFPFTARLNGNTLVLTTADTTYNLSKQGGNTPVNPLGGR